MQFPARYRHAAKIAAKDPGRFRMDYLQLDGSELIATNGRMAVILPVQRDEHDADGFVTVDALLAACKAKGPRNAGPVLLANGDLRAPFANYLAPRPTEGEFPKVRAVVPTFKAGDEGTASVTFDAELLAQIAACLTTDDLKGVTITFKLGREIRKEGLRGEVIGRDMTRADLSPILVVGHRDSARGVLMPMTVDPA